MLPRLSLSQELFPVQALFNAIPVNKFTTAMRYFSQSVGVGYDEVCCEFSDESEDQSYVGVRFWIFDEEVTLSHDEFFKFLSMACVSQTNSFPEQLNEIQQLLAEVKNNLKV